MTWKLNTVATVDEVFAWQRTLSRSFEKQCLAGLDQLTEMSSKVSGWMRLKIEILLVD